MSVRRDLSGTRLGVRCLDDGWAEAVVWAPKCSQVEVEICGERQRLEADSGGLFGGSFPAEEGADYRFVLDGGAGYADPYSRAQPWGVIGPSALIDTGRLNAAVAPFQTPSLDELVIYELHVGTFTSEGTFSGVIEHLGELRSLGVRAIEVMPIATFPGRRGWGYDGLYTSAPLEVYGGPAGFAALVDAAHNNGLGVILDVVYNHLGPGKDALTAFGPYLRASRQNSWGGVLDYSEPAVREWAIQNAELWIADYRVDGLRIDAAHEVLDESEPHVLAELAARVHRLNPRALVISEIRTGDDRPIDRWGHDAQWGDQLHHAVHVLLTDEHEGYYAEYGQVEDVALALARPERERLVVCAQNHDQVGNRALGDRLHGAKLRLAAFCALLSPGTPLLFMGEEHDEPHPFLYFTDHLDPAVAEATRSGRRREFAGFTAFSSENVPDPQAESTFVASVVAHPPFGETSRYYEELLTWRRRLAGAPLRVTLVDELRRQLRVTRGEVELAMNFSDIEVDGLQPWSAEVRG